VQAAVEDVSVAADCQGCSRHWASANVFAVASAHASRHGHQVVVTTVRRYTFTPVAALGVAQPALFDLPGDPLPV
jgi:hypothetical protein